VGLNDEDRKMIESMLEEGSDPGSRARDEASTIADHQEADDTLQQVHKRFVEILSSIEESINSAEAVITEKMDAVMEIITKELMGLGLGVFATRAASTVKSRLRENLSAAEQLSSVSLALKEAKERLDSMVLTTSSGLTLQIFQSASQQQDRLVQLYAKLNELDKQLESTSAEVRIWRSRSSEQEEVIRLKDEAIEQSTKNIEDLRTTLAELRSTLEEKNAEIAELKGQVGQAEVQIGEQKGLLSQVETSDELITQYESRVEELATVRGQIMVLEDKLHQRDAAMDLLKKEIRELEESKAALESKIETMNYESAEWKGLKDTQTAEIESLRAKVQEMETRWDALYQIAEDEPAFKAYFIIAGKTNWFPLQHLSSALGIPTILLKRQMQKFIDAGLVEIKDDKIRPKTLSGEDSELDEVLETLSDLE
jgi:chromosome segregation ATPase